MCKLILLFAVVFYLVVVVLVFNSGIEICNLLGHYAVLSGNSVPTLWDNLSVPSPRVKKSKKTLVDFFGGLRSGMVAEL